MTDEAFKITIKGPGLTFDQAVDITRANKIMSFVMTGSAVLEGGFGGSYLGNVAGAVAGAKLAGLNPKQFIAQKKPKTQYERIACLAYYLTNERGTAQFGTEEIVALNTEAAQATIRNAPAIVRDTTSKYHYLSAAENRQKQITALGEAVVDALPNREAVTAAKKEHGSTKKRKKRAPNKK